MDKNLVKQIYDIKIKQIKAKINLKVEDEAYFASELDCILNLLMLELILYLDYVNNLDKE